MLTSNVGTVQAWSLTHDEQVADHDVDKLASLPVIEQAHGFSLWDDVWT